MAERLSGGTGRRRIVNTRRRLLLTDHQKQCATTAGSRWYIPGYVCEYCQELAAGAPVVIDSSTLMCALLHAGLPGIDDYAFGGRHCGKQFLLDVDGTLSEWTEPEEIPIYQLH